MRILRLEHVADPNRGPWYMREEDNWSYMIFGERPNYGAYAADNTAEKQGVMGPSAHPAPRHESALLNVLQAGGVDHREYFFGFANPEQYAEWFRTPEVRKAVMRGKIHLVCYEVPDERVTVGESQVIFKMTDVIHKEPVDSKYAIYLTP